MKKRLHELLSRRLLPEDLAKVSSSYDIVGDIAIIRLTDTPVSNAEQIANALMDFHKNVKTVLAQTSPVAGDFRLRRLTHIAGENRTRTLHRESGCLFSVDLAECYFSPRLSHERLRIAGLSKPGETVVNMFAGVGCFSILIAKYVINVKVYSIDVNPVAVQFMSENIRLNRVYEKVTPLMGDSKEIIERKLRSVADRVLMPLPEKALEYLPSAVLALKPSGGWIHYYDFEHAQKSECSVEKTKLKVAEKLDELGVDYEFAFSRIVRPVGPNWHQVVLDIHIKEFHTNLNNYIKHVSFRELEMKRKLMEILACPIDKYHPLELHVFEEKDEIVEGLIVCPKCLRWYPIRDEIPEMLPDELRKEAEDLPFLKKWASKIPAKIVSEGKPFNIKSK